MPLKSLILFLFLAFALHANAITMQTDTSAYQTQRLKVNVLLNQRSIKFGQYDQSLSSRTGIFGLQTKGDIMKSNEILRQIVLNDNNIFKELKILMDYKDQEVKAAKNTASTVNSRMLNYMQSIKKLQDQNERLTKETSSSTIGGLSNIIIILLILALAGIYFFFQNKLKHSKSVQ
ncbi:hypothetical protein ACVWYN_001368 [Pedobacter sp. UYP24]